MKEANSFGGPRSNYYAVIDIGTVTCRMLLAVLDKAGVLREIHREYAVVNLGEGVDATRKLSLEAIERVAQTVASYKKLLFSLVNDHELKLFVVATSAARDALNRESLVGRLAEEGVKLHIISGEKEAQLSFLGASSVYTKEDLLVVDVGGGSTEIITGRAGNSPVCSHSFNVGCRRMTERFLLSDPPSEDEIKQAFLWAQEEMTSFFDDLRRQKFSWQHLVAVAGSATTAISIQRQMKVYDAAAVHGSFISRDDLASELDQLAHLTLEQRREVVGLDPDRASVIVAGFIILLAVLHLAKVDGFTASEADLLQGALMDATGFDFAAGSIVSK